MNVRNRKLGGLLSIVVAVSALALGSCEDTGDGDSDGGTGSGIPGLDQFERICGLSCPAKGVVEGNASISGYGAIDEFFGSVVKYQTVSANVSAGIQAELAEIQAGFRITPAELSAAGGNVNAAIKAKLTATVDGAVVLRAQPARCEIDARATFEARARCEASAGCNVMATPPMVNLECSGTCEADVSVMASCSGSAKMECTVRDPNFMCTGACDGECTVSSAVAATCNGTCNGTCSGSCSVMGADGKCAGTCNGMCTGECTLNADVTAQCNGKCSGECTYTPPSASCQANATVRCTAEANAKVMCQGRCDGEVTPPQVNAMCDAKATCEASAKADASLSVQCKPPSLELAYKLKAGVTGTAVADVRTGLNTLKAHWPALAASVKKADLVVKAGASLTADANGAIMASVQALGSANLDFVAKYRVARCVPNEVPRVSMVITSANAKLNAQLTAAKSLGAETGITVM